jgi:hypothetical protein
MKITTPLALAVAGLALAFTTACGSEPTPEQGNPTVSDTSMMDHVRQDSGCARSADAGTAADLPAWELQAKAGLEAARRQRCTNALDLTDRRATIHSAADR